MKTNKELKAEYKQKTPVMGVFQVQNKVSGKVLIDASTSMMSKWNRHRTELKFGSHRNRALQSDWNSLGEENFLFSVVSKLEFKETENLNWNKEVKILKEMVEEEMEIQEDMKY